MAQPVQRLEGAASAGTRYHCLGNRTRRQHGNTGPGRQKPIIDLVVVIPTGDTLPQAIERLATLGYVHRGDIGIAGREAFDAPVEAIRQHLYVCARDSAELRRHILFRDYLRTHHDLAWEYETIKFALAARFRDDREAYTNGKAGFVQSVLDLAEQPNPDLKC